MAESERTFNRQKPGDKTSEPERELGEVKRLLMERITFYGNEFLKRKKSKETGEIIARESIPTPSGLVTKEREISTEQLGERIFGLQEALTILDGQRDPLLQFPDESTNRS